MCGIAAISRAQRSAIPNPKLFMQLASYAIESRGPHATGFGWRDDTRGKTLYWRMPGKATQVADLAPINGNIGVAIAHTRFTTQGPASDNNNNHPIVEDGIVLVHNGIVNNDDAILSSIEGYERFNRVDSQAIAALLAYPEKFGCSTAPEVLEKLEGDAALAWLDTDQPGKLNLAVHRGRPMMLAWTKRNDLVMASTDEALDLIQRWSGVKLPDKDRHEVKDGTWLLVENGTIIDKAQFTPPTPVRKFTPHPTTTTPPRPSGYSSPYAGGGTTIVKSPVTTIKTELGSAAKTTVTEPDSRPFVARPVKPSGHPDGWSTDDVESQMCWEWDVCKADFSPGIWGDMIHGYRLEAVEDYEYDQIHEIDRHLYGGVWTEDGWAYKRGRHAAGRWQD